MSCSPARHALPRLVAVGVVVAALVLLLTGCSQDSGSGAESPADNAAAEQPSTEKPAEEKPAYTSWTVNINDHDTHLKGGITYTVTLNLTATNPTPNKAGTYTGKAVAKTESSGATPGGQLNASAIANSSQLEFTLESAGGTDDDPLTALDEDSGAYSGTGTIAMNAAGSGTVGAAGGSFAKSSAEALNVKSVGEAVTLSVVLNGQKYTFNGTISGK